MKKKILIFSDCFTYSGSENVIENILVSDQLNEQYDIHFIYGYNPSYKQRFEERARLLGFKTDKTKSVKLFSPDSTIYQYRVSKPGFKKKRLFIKAVFLKVLKLFFISHLVNFFILKNAFKKVNADIIYINNGGYPASLQCCLAVFVSKYINISKIYFNINNMATPRSRFYDKFIDSYIEKSVSKFITASKAAQEHACKIRGFNENKFIQIPNTIYNDLVFKNEYKTDKLRENVVTFGSVGLLTERKGYHVLLKAIKILVEEFQKLNFVVQIIGDGEDKQKLNQLITQLNIGRYVDLLGFRSNPWVELNNFDVFVLPSIRNEDFPYVILEAMLLSKPVIGTRVAGIPEQIEDLRSGILVDPDDERQLANAMNYFIENIDKISVFGSRSNYLYLKKFSYKETLNVYLKLFSS